MTSIQPRPATDAELSAWRILNEKFARTTRNVDAMLSTAKLAANINIDAKKAGLPLNIWSSVEENSLQEILRQYNTMGRIISGAKLNKYFITLEKGDLTIWASPSMSREEYEPDVLGFVFVALMIGAVLITGAIAYIDTLDYKVRMADDSYRNRLLDADIKMSKAPKKQQDFWLNSKRLNTDAAKAAAKQHEPGWFEKMFSGLGGGLGLGVGMLAVGGIAFLALSQMGKRKQAKA